MIAKRTLWTPRFLISPQANKIQNETRDVREDRGTQKKEQGRGRRRQSSCNEYEVVVGRQIHNLKNNMKEKKEKMT